MDFRNTTIERLSRAIQSRELTAEQVLTETLGRIDSYNEKLKAFVSLADPERLLAEARAIDKRVVKGEVVGPLAGVPVGVKDIEDVIGLPTTFGSQLLGEPVVKDFDSIGVHRLRAAGALIVGKTNTSEFACKATTDNPRFGATVNPWNVAYSCGGSSGGSAVALAAGLVPLATGTDGGGSLRIPASVCGFSGYKPSTGLVPSGDSDPPMCGALIVRGPMARTIRDTALALSVMKGYAASDLFSLADDATDWRDAWTSAAQLGTVIWSPTLGFAEIDENVREVCEVAIERLRQSGVNVIRRDQVIAEDPMPYWQTMWNTGLAAALAGRLDPGNVERIDPALQRMVSAGRTVSGTDYIRSLDACHRYNIQLDRAFDDAPFILSPTCAGQTPRLNEGGMVNGRKTDKWTQLTQVLNMTRHPAATVHAGVNASGLPVGLQVIGRARRDLETLVAAAGIEQLLGGPGSPDLPA